MTSAYSGKTTALPMALLLSVISIAFGCQTHDQPKDHRTPQAAPPLVSKITVSIVESAEIEINSADAEFVLLPTGYLRGYLKSGTERLTLDDPTSTGSAESVVIDGKELNDFSLDLANAKISEASHRLGATGKRVEITGKSISRPEIEKKIAIELYDDFSALALSTTTYKNAGSKPAAFDAVTVQAHRLSASLTDPMASPYDMWSFHGSSEKWGKDDVIKIGKGFSRANPMEQIIQGSPGTGGGLPVVAFWSKNIGEAIGHVETLPLILSIPVRTEADGRTDASVQLNPKMALQPGETYSTPLTFLAVYRGDFYEPLRLYSRALAAQGVKNAAPTNADYEANWCGWGYQLQFKPAQIVGTIPKLKELGLKWATLDAGWFNNRGDWQPRPDIGEDGIKKMVDTFHQEGIKLTLWWIPIVAEDGQGKDILDGRPYKLSDVVRDHPDWLILDKNGKHAKLTSGFAGLCPAIPEVQQYYRQLTERFVRDWGFDGHKLDFSFSVPPCYNPKHHHKSPEDSTRAMGEIYNIIFQTTRGLKPESVTQACPCGTPPNMAWLPFIDQAVTADPVGAVQVRRRIKMYKALLGPDAAVYGDHVELTRIVGANTQHEEDNGRDFASTLGTGGVIGTKFTWPAYGPKFKSVEMTPQKEAYWRKWIDLYNEKALSRGTFRNLYTTGYDMPEGYAVEKDGKMFYAFFATSPWKGTLQLRGLQPGTYHVQDYENGKELRTVDGARGELPTHFQDHLLLEVQKQ
jgi:alpha-galactosidase